MGTDRVVSLIRSHRVRIARALVRQTRALAPRYEQLDQTAQERSFLALLIAVDRLLSAGDDRPLLDTAANIAQLRNSMGFHVEDFALASLGFLPVIRRFIVEHSASLQEGLEDYEAFESVALPFIGRASSIFLDAAEDPTVPNNVRPLVAQRVKTDRDAGALRPLRIERVTGTQEEEETYRNHPLFSTIS
jgi:hypothetical protein